MPRPGHEYVTRRAPGCIAVASGRLTGYLEQLGFNQGFTRSGRDSTRAMLMVRVARRSTRDALARRCSAMLNPGDRSQYVNNLEATFCGRLRDNGDLLMSQLCMPRFLTHALQFLFFGFANPNPQTRAPNACNSLLRKPLALPNC